MVNKSKKKNNTKNKRLIKMILTGLAIFVGVFTLAGIITVFAIIKGAPELDPEKLTFTADLLDSDIGPANVLHYTNDGEDYILSANREIDEIALYKVEK